MYIALTYNDKFYIIIFLYQIFNLKFFSSHKSHETSERTVRKCENRKFDRKYLFYEGLQKSFLIF